MADFPKIERYAKIFFRYLLGIVFVVSGISKLIAPENFIQEIGKLFYFHTNIIV